MANASEISVGLMHELAVAGCEEGWEPKDFDTFKRDRPLLASVLAVMRGTHTIQAVEHAVDLSAIPLVPTGWSLEDHQEGLVVKLEKKLDGLYADGKRMNFYLSKKQKKGVIGGTTLREELKDKPRANACVLDYLLAHPELIPEDWKGKAVFFWGTIYRSSSGNLCVCCLVWFGDGWGWHYDWLANVWDARIPALLLAS